MQFPMFKDSGGQKSISFTMMVVGFSVITLWLLLSVFESIAGMPIRAFSGSEAIAYFSPLAMLYFSRRWTTATKGGTNPLSGIVDALEGDGPKAPDEKDEGVSAPPVAEDDAKKEQGEEKK